MLFFPPRGMGGEGEGGGILALVEQISYEIFFGLSRKKARLAKVELGMKSRPNDAKGKGRGEAKDTLEK